MADHPDTNSGQPSPNEMEAAPAAIPPSFEPDPRSTFKSQKRRLLEAFERSYLIRLMTVFGGNVSRAAKAAGKERRDLGKLLKRYGLGSRQFARPPQTQRQKASVD